MIHPATSRTGARPTSPREQLETIKFAKSGLRYAKALRDKQEIDDLTTKFAQLSLHDHSVMNVVSHRSIFHTDR